MIYTDINIFAHLKPCAKCAKICTSRKCLRLQYASVSAPPSTSIGEALPPGTFASLRAIPGGRSPEHTGAAPNQGPNTLGQSSCHKGELLLTARDELLRPRASCSLSLSQVPHYSHSLTRPWRLNMDIHRAINS